jgi:hypothetical protein
MRYAPRLYKKFQRALAHLATAAEAGADEVLGFIALRSAILVDLGLPATARNVDRLILCASIGLPLRVFVEDVDRAPPRDAAGYFEAGTCFENHPPVSASRSAVSASMRS